MATFTFYERSFIGDLDAIDSLNSEVSKDMFKGFLRRKPTLEMALREAGVPNHDIVLDNAMEYADNARDDPEIASLGLTDDEAGAISCYTLQSAKGVKSPYDIINYGLAGSRDRTGLFSTRKLIYLLLSGLRKLPRTRPSRGQMFYRGIRLRVPRTKEEANGHQYYGDGRTVTWWGFTSTTTSLKATQNFIKGAQASTLFNIGGEDLWGYDIKAFSPFKKEEEVLLEPETKIFIKEDGNIELGTTLVIHVTIQKFEHLVLEDIIPVGGSKVISTQRDPVFTQQKEVRVGISNGEKLIKPQTAQKKVVEKKWECAWKECPGNVDGRKKYSVDGKNPRIASKEGSDDRYFCTIIGNTPLPPSKVTSWSIKVLKSKENNGDGIHIGVAPFNIDQNEDGNYYKCGWYFGCNYSSLHSGPPHKYRAKEYGPRKEKGKYVHKGDSVGVVMDTAKGELSFVLNGVNLGVAYKGIPLDKPLVPCVNLKYKGDSIGLVI